MTKELVDPSWTFRAWTRARAIPRSLLSRLLSWVVRLPMRLIFVEKPSAPHWGVLCAEKANEYMLLTAWAQSGRELGTFDRLLLAREAKREFRQHYFNFAKYSPWSNIVAAVSVLVLLYWYFLDWLGSLAGAWWEGNEGWHIGAAISLLIVVYFGVKWAAIYLACSFNWIREASNIERFLNTQRRKK